MIDANEYHSPRNWENLPSMAVAPVPRGFSWGTLCDWIRQKAPEKEVVCLVHLDWAVSRENAQREIDLLYEFADNPLLVLMRFLAPIPGTERLIVRAWFMRETASQVSATNLFEAAERLSQLARQKGYNTMTVD